MAVKDKDRKKSEKRKGGDADASAERHDFSYTQNRELSWLRFDDRVLTEAYDETVPLFERLKFVAIFESNLDEFFMVRIGGLSDLATLKHQPRDNKSNLTPAEQIDRVFEALPTLYTRQQTVFHRLEDELAKRGMIRMEPATLVGDERMFVENYFKAYISPIISPLVIDPRHPFPNLRNEGLYLVCGLEGAPDSDESGLLGLIEVPPALPRVIQIPCGAAEYHYILVEDIIMACIDRCFGTYVPLDRAVIRVIRNADIDPDGEGVEEDEDYRQHMKRILKKRLRLQPVYLYIRGALERSTVKFIRRALELSGRATATVDIPLDLGYVYSLESHIPEAAKKELLFEPFQPQPSPVFDLSRSMREQVIEGDKLLFYPYEAMTPFLNLVHEAAYDDECISIRITLYRVAKQSRLCESLITAAENGKEVTVLMELRARFAEENNIEWAERLEEAGCTVIYGSEGFKCHSKICQLTYREGMAVTRLTLLGTGNFNEKTAKLYSDFMLMTAHPGIGEDANSFFRNLSLGNLRGDYRYLGVAPAGLKPLIMTGLNREIDRAQAGLPARVFLKMNSLTDREVIDKISEASCAGVHVEMIIRGISCLLPGIPDKTENVHIRSIVGRFLEHARVYAFGEDADTVYLSSADMMTRNTEHRVEIAFPVLDADIRAQVIEYMDIQLADNVKARELTSAGTWAPVEVEADAAPFIAQERLMELATERASKAEKARAKRAVARPSVPMGTPPATAVEAGGDDAAAAAAAPAPAPATSSAPTPQAPTPAASPMPAPAAHMAAPKPEAAHAAPAHAAATAPETAAARTPQPQPTHLKATLIEPEPPCKSTASDENTVVVRRHGRVGTGIALVGLGLKTLLFGSKKDKKRR